VVRRIRQRLSSEAGFTLPEVLVVMVILGILAALAYAVFIGQRTKAKDADAKDNVAALAVEVESCRVETENFKKCDEMIPGELDPTGLPFDDTVSISVGCATIPPDPTPATPPERNKVAVIRVDTDCYVVEAQTDDGHFFWLWHRPDNVRERQCTPAGQGGCVDDPSNPGTIGIWSKAGGG
jgi:prepilin-type N-terminal cleavage/methylation domain-containing protein